MLLALIFHIKRVWLETRGNVLFIEVRHTTVFIQCFIICLRLHNKIVCDYVCMYVCLYVYLYVCLLSVCIYVRLSGAYQVVHNGGMNIQT